MISIAAVLMITAIIGWFHDVIYHTENENGGHSAGFLRRSLIVDPSVIGLLCGIFSIGSLVLMTMAMTNMYRTRNAMKQIAGTEFSDDGWSFGQVLAVSTWIPLLLNFAWLSIGNATIHLSSITLSTCR